MREEANQVDRCLGGVCLGWTLAEVLAVPGFALAPEESDPDLRVEGSCSVWREHPRTLASVSCDVVWAIAVHEEFRVDDENVIGASFDDAQASFGGIDVCLDSREPIQMYRTNDGHDVWVRDGQVIQVHLQDDSLIVDDATE